MAAVKKKRPYDSSRRREQAAETRRRIIETAAGLFESLGYARTTIRQIADDAGVAADTIYATFGTKARVLTAVIDLRLAPGDEVDSILDTPAARAVRDEPDQRRQLHLFAQQIAAMSAGVRPIFEVLRTASAVEPEMGPVYAEMEGYRAHNMRQAAEWVAAHGPLRVTTEEAGEIIWALASPDVARLLCDRQGWSIERYASWLEDTLVRTLLPD